MTVLQLKKLLKARGLKVARVSRLVSMRPSHATAACDASVVCSQPPQPCDCFGVPDYTKSRAAALCNTWLIGHLRQWGACALCIVRGRSQGRRPSWSPVSRTRMAQRRPVTHSRISLSLSLSLSLFSLSHTSLSLTLLLARHNFRWPAVLNKFVHPT